MTTETLSPETFAFELTEYELDILLWRFEQFVRLDFGEEHAWTLAYSNADLGQARWLRRGGCSCELSLRILL